MLLVELLVIFVKKHYFLLGILILNSWCQETDDLLSLPSVEVAALVGKNAVLPCDVTPNSPEERIYMVLWFQLNWGKPLYTYDVRGRSLGKALHWSDPNVFAQRATFVTNQKSGALHIKGVMLKDHGIYRCRVDFKNSPTKNTQILLNVIVPPQKMLLSMKDPNGEIKAVSEIVGPLLEGQSFTMYCEVQGGRPKPNVSWYHNNKTILDVARIEGDNETQLTHVNMTNALRTWHDSVVQCQAFNTYLDRPYGRMATIKMHLKPSSIRIMNKTRVVKDDHEYILECISCGSQPPAEITWYRDNEAFPEYLYRELKTNETCTISRAALRPTPDKDGQIIKCRAENRLLSTSLEDSYQIEVRHKPVVNLTFGRSIKENKIKEGDNVYFDCNYKSNPKELRVNWYFKDQLVVQNPGAGVVIAESSLILRSVKRSQIGLYSCKVTNIFGTTTSQQVYLRIQYAPVCAMDTPIVIGALLNEVLHLNCTASSDPFPATYMWLFNNSIESFKLKGYINGTMSVLYYKITSERNFGSLDCWALNSIGKQIGPCVILIVPAVKPAAVRRCKYYKIMKPEEPPMLAIRCLVGYDGAKLQHFTLETTGKPRKLLVKTSYVDVDGVLEEPKYSNYFLAKTQKPMYVWLNVSLAELEDVPNDLALIVTARNAVGYSAPYIIKGIVINKDAGGAGKKPVSMALDIYILPITAASIGALVLVTLAVTYSAYLCRQRAEMVTSTVPVNKPPTQSVVQVDSKERTRMFAYHANDPEAKPDILLPKTDNAPSRVVLESSGKMYKLKEHTLR